MKYSTFALAVIAALLALFTALNWPLFLAPATLNLLFADVQAPLGLILLAALLLVAGICAAYVSALKTGQLLESRRMAKALEEQRAIADNAEKSRLTELRAQLRQDLENMTATNLRLNEEMRLEVRQSGNSLAAALAEMDDRLSGRMQSPTL